MNICFISLGCARNQIDTETMTALVRDAGHHISDAPEQADVIVVNSCSFIRSAVDESIDTILELAAYKQTGNCRRLIVTGCLPQRYQAPIAEALPEVDAFLGTGAYEQILEVISGPDDAGICILPPPGNRPNRHRRFPRPAPTAPVAYVKTSEGCSHHCTYCIIPALRGPYQSRPIDMIAEEVTELLTPFVQEVVLVAENTSRFGSDLLPPQDLADLLDALIPIIGDRWLRVLYGYPSDLTPRALERIGTGAGVVPYFDLPIQHASSAMLKKMARQYTHDDLLRLFDTLRDQYPDAALRTTLITGFPGETDADVETAMALMERVAFDHLGVFTYSDGEDLPAHRLPGPVPEPVAQERYDALMALQADISHARNKTRIGTTCQVLIEEMPEPGTFVGRGPFQAPDVDGGVHIHADHLSIGSFCTVRLTEAYPYDLIGALI
ncbi:MAG: 30S ribosomal protein S12 methylthiotransferase RimO [Deltaproteobacteria bacterium]|nr:MAG: 30S ribosomal protein S12 methylthiotransferase RimO [Deltaproteobacteria bacterium]